MAKFLSESGLSTLWGRIGTYFVRKETGTVASPESITGVKQFTNGFLVNSGASFTSTDRAIPFSAEGNNQLIQYSDAGLVYNPSLKVLKVNNSEVLTAGSLTSSTYVDTIPTSGSTKLISSGGMYSVLEELEDTVATSENALNNRVTILENAIASDDIATIQEIDALFASSSGSNYDSVGSM